MAITPIAVSPSLASVLNAAGDRNDVDFDYLLKTAMRESRLNPTAKAGTSSATGLFQFLDSTWLQVMKNQGPRLGYQAYADAITRKADGEYVIADPKIRAEVLKLRENPQIAADMAAAFTKANGDYLKARFGRMPSPGELYIAHFLGAQGAERMFNAGLKNPDQIAANLFPREAAANKTIFYDHGTPRTIRQVYKALVAQHEGPAALHAGYAAQQIAAQQSPPGTAAPVPLAPVRTVQQATQYQLPQVAAASPATVVPAAPRAPAPLAPAPASTAAPGLGDPMLHYQVIETPVAAPSPPSIGHSRPVTGSPGAAPEIPSRIGPQNMSFAALFSTEPEGGSGAPVDIPSEDGGAFFSQLYGQQ
jgi:hypothetical protein